MYRIGWVYVLFCPPFLELSRLLKDEATSLTILLPFYKPLSSLLCYAHCITYYSVAQCLPRLASNSGG